MWTRSKPLGQVSWVRAHSKGGGDVKSWNHGHQRILVSYDVKWYLLLNILVYSTSNSMSARFIFLSFSSLVRRWGSCFSIRKKSIKKISAWHVTTSLIEKHIIFYFMKTLYIFMLTFSQVIAIVSLLCLFTICHDNYEVKPLRLLRLAMKPRFTHGVVTTSYLR